MSLKSLFAALVLAGLGIGLVYWEDNKNTEPLLRRMEAPLPSEKAREPQTETSKKEKDQNLLKSGKVESSSPLRQVDEVRQELQKIEACVPGKCPFPDEDPRAFELARGRALQAELQKLSRYLMENPQRNAEMENLAREYMDSTDSFVQQAALEILSTQPPSAVNRNLIVQNILPSTSPNLVLMGMVELEKYKTAAASEQTHERLREILLFGSPIAAEKVATQLRHLLTPTELPAYRSILGKISSSKLRHLVESSLRSFEEQS